MNDVTARDTVEDAGAAMTSGWAAVGGRSRNTASVRPAARSAMRWDRRLDMSQRSARQRLVRMDAGTLEFGLIPSEPEAHVVQLDGAVPELDHEDLARISRRDDQRLSLAQFRGFKGDPVLRCDAQPPRLAPGAKDADSREIDLGIEHLEHRPEHRRKPGNRIFTRSQPCGFFGNDNEAVGGN